MLAVSGTDNGCFDLEGHVIEPAALPAAARRSCLDGARTLNFLTDTWKLTHLRLFNPLIFSCVFGDDAVFDCFGLLARSLLTVGQYHGDIAVMTDPEGVARLEALKRSLPMSGAFEIVVLADCHDEMDYCLARFRFHDHPFFADRQPLVYLDADILCNAPIEPLLAEMVFSDGISVSPEGILNEGNPNSDGHWYGWRMMAAAGMEFDPHQRGFSAGAIGYSHSDVALEYARLVMEVAQGYRRESGQKRPFVGYDQCVANYVFLKARIREFGHIGAAVTLHRVQPDHLSRFPPEKRGLIHFLAVPFPQKLEAMKLYQARFASA